MGHTNILNYKSYGDDQEVLEYHSVTMVIHKYTRVVLHEPRAFFALTVVADNGYEAEDFIGLDVTITDLYVGDLSQEAIFPTSLELAVRLLGALFDGLPRIKCDKVEFVYRVESDAEKVQYETDPGSKILIEAIDQLFDTIQDGDTVHYISKITPNQKGDLYVS